ncbi:hypothetical protein WJX75_001884 [Coccomyxa subellipsoidea]|uniref:Uncharacterized protein n=1 Tax=Coccomyxa subellipsoidea TaxID=248742 RepID=A0ABR2YAG4_9CHLO
MSSNGYRLAAVDITNHLARYQAIYLQPEEPRARAGGSWICASTRKNPGAQARGGGRVTRNWKHAALLLQLLEGLELYHQKRPSTAGIHLRMEAYQLAVRFFFLCALARYLPDLVSTNAVTFVISQQTGLQDGATPALILGHCACKAKKAKKRCRSTFLSPKDCSGNDLDRCL